MLGKSVVRIILDEFAKSSPSHNIDTRRRRHKEPSTIVYQRLELISYRITTVGINKCTMIIIQNRRHNCRSSSEISVINGLNSTGLKMCQTTQSCRKWSYAGHRSDGR
jgi:hypothetical protein